ncbi:MAG: DUF2927 domain-containing protein [Gemmobacter sp.]
MRLLALWSLAAAVLAGCEPLPPAPGPAVRPAPRVEAPPAPSPRSVAVRDHFARVQTDLLRQGLLRTDGGGADTPFGPRQVVENFVRIALHDEYVSSGGRLVASATPAPLRRFEAPVRIGLRFGASVPAPQQARDRASVAAYAQRLARASGHPIRLTDQNPNFWVYVVSEDERPALGQEWAGLFPGLTAQDLRPATGMGLSTFCMVIAISAGDSPVYTGALAVIRSELPDLLRLSCLHEEIAQGLGLANDDPRVRPSIFNDDEEFATLTRHDELLLRILYDRRLRPGMREPEARPIVRQIVAGLLGPAS